MKKFNFKKKVIKSLFASGLILALSLSPVSVYNVGAAGSSDTYSDADNSNKVYDYADLFDDSEEKDFAGLCKKYSEKYQLDFVVVTTSDADGKSSMEYADDFYDQGQFGYEGPYGSGLLYLIDMDNRQMYISTAGLAIMYFNDDDIDTLLDAIEDDVRSGYYGDSVYSLFDEIDDILGEKVKDRDYKDLKQKWLEGKYYESDYVYFEDRYRDEIADLDKSNLFTCFKNPLISIIVAAVITCIAIVIMNINSKTKMTAGSRTYMENGSFHINNARDVFTHTNTTTRTIESSSGGSGGGGSHHSSSGGHSHGGGGRGF